MRKYYFVLLIIFLLPIKAFSISAVIDSNYTYDYSQPPEFQPSMTSQFTSLSRGVLDVYANPAGIMHINTLEVAAGLTGFVRNPIGSDQNFIYVDDKSLGGIENSPNSRAFVRISDDRNAITPETRAVAINEDYSKGGGINYFGMTYRVTDWLAFSVSRKRPTSINFNYQMLAPLMLDAQANFRGMSIEAGGAGNYVQIRNDGTIEVVVSGIPVTSEVAAWSGFLEQGTSEVNWMNGEFNNSIVNQNSVVITAAGNINQVSWGLNVIPMTVDMQLNNEIAVYSDANNNNMTVYLPKFSFSSSEEAINWVTYESGQASGYHGISVESLAGQQIGGAKIAGKYSGSFVRMDLGLQWEPNDFLSFGAVYENFNGASLKMSGVNVVQYVQHRVNTASKMPTEETASYWNPYYDTPTHEVETEETIRNILTMQPIEMPKKLKFGMALKKPFLMALDWEQWQNEYKYSSDPGHPDTAHYITMSNISFLRLGAESQIMFLPMIVRGSLTGLFRPVSNDKDVEKSLDDLYEKLPIVPVDGNIYFGFGVLDGELGFGVGGGGLPLIQAVMFDVSTIAKVFYSNVYYKKGDWQVSYLMTMDPVLTGFSSDVSTTAGESSTVRLMATSTLGIGFRF
jgi:hypothetical protein